MLGIGAVGRPEAVQATSRSTAGPARRTLPTVVAARIDGPQAERGPGPTPGPSPLTAGGTRPRAAFLTQLIVSCEPTLRPSRAV